MPSTPVLIFLLQVLHGKGLLQTLHHYVGSSRKKNPHILESDSGDDGY